MAVSSVSYTNTPQAGDDVYEFQEDYFNSHTSALLDVMANDLGGKSKTLYSIDDSDSALKDLLTSDVGKSMVSDWETTKDGNQIRINCGKIEFKFADNFDVNSVAAGETYSDSFVYAIRLGNGTLSHATVTLNVAGSNDAATFSGDDAKSIDENGTTVDGKLNVSDLDHDQSAMQAGTLTSAIGHLDLAADGNWTYSLDKAQDQLAEGEHGYDTFTVKSVDGTTHDITITINGSNDAATFSGDDGKSIDENGTTVDGKLNVSDLDHDQSAMHAGTLTGAVGHLDLAADGNWTYSLDKAQDQLAEGEHGYDTFTVTSTDGTTHDIEITIDGSNDVASITGDSAGSVTEDGVLSAGGKLDVSDLDNGQAHFQAPDSASLSGAYGDFTFSDNGDWTYVLRNTDTDVQALNSGDQKHDTLTIWSADHSTSQTIDVSINGVNEAVTQPVRAAAPAVFAGGGDPNDFDSATGTPTETSNGDSVIVGDDNGNTLTGIDSKDGADVIYGLGGNDIISGGDKADTLYGNTGNDTVSGDTQADVIYGGSGNDVLYGGDQNDVLYGGSGNDQIYGDDHNDTIVGGYGADVLTGGTGFSDTFKFLDVKDTGDIINDFDVSLDHLDFTDIDANTAIPDDQSFGFAGNSIGLVAHSINWFTEGGNTIVQFDNDGNTSTAEFEITLAGNLSLTESQFLL